MQLRKSYSMQQWESLYSWQNMVRHYRVEDANVEPMITLQATDNWIEFTVRYVVDYRKRRWMKDHLFTRILEEVVNPHGLGVPELYPK